MLPNWLYGKSKSKLQEILGGGGGGTNYTAGDGIDISNGVISFDPETTPAIDPSKIDGLDDDLAALAPKAAISNPNLLDNPWFTVNQRGQTTYIPDSARYYTVDRWMLENAQGLGTLTVNNDGTITVSNTGNSAFNFSLYAPLSEFKVATGEVYTTTIDVTAVTGDIRIYSIIQNSSPFKYTSRLDLNTTGIHSVTGQVPSDFTTGITLFRPITFEISPGDSITIRAVKLELGSVSTLAMDTAPNYATELAKCQRYFQRINLPTHSMLLAGITRDTSNATLTFPLPEMRSTPTYTASGIEYRGSSNSVLAFTLDNVEMHKGGFICVNFRSGNHTAWQPIAIRAASDSGGYIDFSAEL